MAATLNHPKVKYAALQLLTELINTFPAELEEKYIQQIVQTIEESIKDAIGRVASAGIICFAAFVHKVAQTWLLPPLMTT